jgi:hypothetical protein
MMEVLAHDIMRYETLSEPSDLFALASALVGNAPNDQYTVIELKYTERFISGAGSLQCKFIQGICPL